MVLNGVADIQLCRQGIFFFKRTAWR